MTRSLLLLLLLGLGLAGCKSGDAPREDARRAPGDLEQEVRADSPRTPAKVAAKPPKKMEEKPDDDAPPPTVANPYGGRTGGKKNGTKKKPKPTRFRAPDPAPQPVGVAARPSIGLRVKLAVVFVKDGVLVKNGAGLLELDTMLADDAQVASVVAARVAGGREVSLDDLAALVRKAGRDLLLVDVRPGSGSADREAFLLHTCSGKKKDQVIVLGRYAVKAGETPKKKETTTSGEAPDLVERLGLAYARMRK